MYINFEIKPVNQRTGFNDKAVTAGCNARFGSEAPEHYMRCLNSHYVADCLNFFIRAASTSELSALAVLFSQRDNCLDRE